MMARFWFALVLVLVGLAECQQQRRRLRRQRQIKDLDIDFSGAEKDPVSGKVCVLQRVCIADLDALPIDSCFPEGCNCNSDTDCADKPGEPFCNDCQCSAFPQGCDCASASDCPDETPFCNNCVCNAFPVGCGCLADSDCGADAPFCAECICSPFPEGCACNVGSDCDASAPFCVDCQCSAFPADCTCNGDSDCSGEAPFCNECNCSAFPEGCDCNSPGDCPASKPFCNDCECSAFPEGCDCASDTDCGGGAFRCLNCTCKDCPVSNRIDSVVINPPLTFVVDTTKSVKPDKYSIFNLTQKVVTRIIDTDVNIPNYLLVTFNDYGPDFRRNVNISLQTRDVLQFKQGIIGLQFESFDGGRDSKERLMQGLLGAVQASPNNSLIVVFTDNGSKDLRLKREILRFKEEKGSTVYIVLTPIYEGFPNDPSLAVYEEVADEVFYISEVGADEFLTSVQEFEEFNCV